MIKKAFTLAEVFIAMVILAVLVSVCVTFFTSKKDYEREYMYYSAYLNLTKVVDSALLNEKYLKDAATPYVEETTCGTNTAPYKCRAFKNTSGTLCKVLSEYFNTTGTVNCSTAGSAASPSFKLTNGMEFYFTNLASSNFANRFEVHGDIPAAENEVFVFTVDINGRGHGEDKDNYDRMRFFVTRSGKVVPDYGPVTGIRGYEFESTYHSVNNEIMDAAGNPALMAFDVVLNKPDSNLPEVLRRSLSFSEAACLSRYIYPGLRYCSRLNVTGAPISLAPITECGDSQNPCEIRLVKKLRRVK